MSAKDLIKCKKCDADIAADAKACPKCGSEAHTYWQKVATRAIGVAIVFGIALKVCGGGPDDKSPSSTSSGPAAPGTGEVVQPSAHAVALLPWVVEADKACNAVKTGVNDIQKNKLFSAFVQTLRSAKVNDIMGTLKSIEALPGGGDVELEVEAWVSGDRHVTFFNSLLDHSISRGSRMFKAIENMPTGACVVFSADHLKPAASDADSVRDLTTTCRTDRFAVRFVQARACGTDAGTGKQ